MGRYTAWCNIAASTTRCLLKSVGDLAVGIGNHLLLLAYCSKSTRDHFDHYIFVSCCLKVCFQMTYFFERVPPRHCQAHHRLCP
jgi:hypothetical protein